MYTVKKINVFAGVWLTATQWQYILKGCGCPKNPYIWFLFKNLLVCRNKTFCLVGELSEESFNEILSESRKRTATSVKKSYRKKLAKQKAVESSTRISSTRFYVSNGVILLEKPETDW